MSELKIVLAANPTFPICNKETTSCLGNCLPQGQKLKHVRDPKSQINSQRIQHIFFVMTVMGEMCEKKISEPHLPKKNQYIKRENIVYRSKKFIIIFT